MIDRLDHLVLTVKDLQRTRAFYVGVLGMEWIEFGDGRQALGFGRQKINLHLAGAEIVPHAEPATPGSADLCFILSVPLDEAIDRVKAGRVPIELGPVERTGALGPIRSIYVRDPDQNLIELSEYRQP